MKKSSVFFAIAAMLLLSGCQTIHTHSYEATAVKPTCTEAGYTVFTCACGATYQDEKLPALGHEYVTSVIAPTYTSPGYTRFACSICDDEYEADFTQMPTDVVSSLAEKDYLPRTQDFSRERKHKPEFVMLHFTSGIVLSRDDPYDKALVRRIFEDYEVSVHYLIDREGGVSCYVPEELVAYHAGRGMWGGNPKYTDSMNDYAIGIELMAIGSEKDMEQYLTADAYRKLKPQHIGFTDAQYEALEALVRDICSRNEIPMDRQHVIGHEAYSSAKTDPGELFDWTWLPMKKSA